MVVIAVAALYCCTCQNSYQLLECSSLIKNVFSETILQVGAGAT
jgi:hypothetical protein